jgi:superoxide dismutase, Cu-Zn family
MEAYMKTMTAAALGLALALAPAAAQQPTVTIPMNLITDGGIGAPIGNVRAEDTGGGLKLTPELAGLPPGPHGLHLHEKPACGPGERDGRMQAGLAAGDHWDPAHTGKHLGPGGQGHKGDLPVLMVDPDGTATTPLAAPNLTVADLAGHALVIHQGGDNYSDQPQPLGGGGARIACGVAERE